MIPTAEEFLQDSFTISHFYNDKYNRMSCFSDDVQKAMIEFAKLHVEAALKTVWANSAEWENGFNLTIRVIDDDEELILNSYPLTNIK